MLQQMAPSAVGRHLVTSPLPVTINCVFLFFSLLLLSANPGGWGWVAAQLTAYNPLLLCGLTHTHHRAEKGPTKSTFYSLLYYTYNEKSNETKPVEMGRPLLPLVSHQKDALLENPSIGSHQLLKWDPKQQK
jgi:hypothetical protein